MILKVKSFVAVTAAVGVAVIVYGLLHWRCDDPLRFVCYLVIAVLASSLKVSLPGIDGTMSVNFLFILIGILELSFPETLVLGCAATLMQCYWGVKNRVQPIHVVFNVAGMMAPAIGASYLAFHEAERLLHGNTPMMLLVAACAYFVTNTIPVRPAGSRHRAWASRRTGHRSASLTQVCRSRSWTITIISCLMAGWS